MTTHTLRSRGFTLIELLVVIAIIGILSAVVLASLNTARSKGTDASIQSDLDSIRTQAELYYSGAGGNSYGTSGASGACTLGMFTDTTIAKAISGADSANGTTGHVYCKSTGNNYAIGADLTATSSWWCVDSNGTSKAVSGTVANTIGAACP